MHASCPLSKPELQDKIVKMDLGGPFYLFHTEEVSLLFFPLLFTSRIRLLVSWDQITEPGLLGLLGCKF